MVGGSGVFEVQGGFIGSHWQDNMVQLFDICWRCDHFVLCAVCWSSTESG